MYPRAFTYHRASSLKEAVTVLSQLGEGAKLLAGGQSLIPLMKLRFANPVHLVDLNFISGTSYVRGQDGALHFGPLTRHAEIEKSASAARVPILLDCAAGIADAGQKSRNHRRLACRGRPQRRLGHRPADALLRSSMRWHIGGTLLEAK